eukprot:Seg2376.2 transcript_id=Seg2376.2/GoldUCD/mRNA.D3Y31 product="Pumilio 3" protein_id=Seg2376.2/GoldUCD/D3Y31
MKRRADRKGPKSSDGFGDLKRKKDGGKKFKPKKSPRPKSASSPGKDKSKKMGAKPKGTSGKKIDKPPKRKSEDVDRDKKEEIAKKKAKTEPRKPFTKKERKMHRRETQEIPGLIGKLMSMYEKLRRKDLSKEAKGEVIDEVLSIIKGKENDVMYKHDCVRVLEFCIKLGNESQREQIYEIYKEHNVELLKSKYAKYLVKKLVKYGTKEQRTLVIKALYGNVKKLVKQKEAAGVLEYIYHQFADASQRASLIEEFYGPQYAVFKAAIGRKLEDIFEKEPDREQDILSHMKASLMPLATKDAVTFTIIHKPLLEFFTFARGSMRADMIEALRERIVHMLHTLEGSKVAMNCIWHGTKKDRKLIIKSFKTFVPKICMEEYGHMVLLALFDAVDDTVAIKKSIISEINSKLEELIQNQYGRKVILYLLSPRGKQYFTPACITALEKGDENATSKKDNLTRQKELRSGILDALFKHLTENAESLIKDKSDCQILLAAVEHSGEADSSVELMKRISKLASKPLDSETNEEDHAITHACAHWVIKRIVQQDKARNEHDEENLFCKILLDIVPEGSLGDWVQYNRGAFVVASLLESGLEDIQNRVKNDLEYLSDKLKPGQTKGMDVVIKLLGSS